MTKFWGTSFSFICNEVCFSLYYGTLDNLIKEFYFTLDVFDCFIDRIVAAALCS